LEKNTERDSVHVTASGLQYEVIQNGNGIKPVLGDTVIILFRGLTQEGQEFMNMYSKPHKMLLQQGTKGGLEALQMMQEGSKYRFYLPTELAYGPNPPPAGILLPNMAVIYDIELLEVIQQHTN
jgi:FKBP-type peptidyl-prolyl cis-trans isomerase